MTVDDMNSKASKGKKKGKGNTNAPPEKENDCPNVNAPNQVNNEDDRRQSLQSSAEVDGGSSHFGDHRPIGNKTAKKIKVEECSSRIAALAQRDMVTINSKRLKLLESQDRQRLFTLRVDDIDEECKDYF
ncbi:unnamed protein product [Calypogeia fissa]